MVQGLQCQQPLQDLHAALEKTDVTIKYDNPVHDLLMLGDSVYRVRTRQQAEFIEYGGQVILALGGFSSNPAMLR